MSVTKVETAINNLKSRIGDRHRELREWENQLENLQVQRTKLVYGAGAGDIVTHKGTEYRVTRFSMLGHGGKPWAHGVSRKKNGEFSAVERTLYSDWETA